MLPPFLMKRNSSAGFTLIEMLVVMAVIGVLAALVVAVSGLAQTTAAKKRAEGEIAAYVSACEMYKGDNGDYPRSNKTDELDPRKEGNPVTGDSREKYQDANLELYSSLSGDFEPEDHPDFKPEKEKKTYFEFKRDQLNIKLDPEGKIKEVNFIQDPWGNCYGYSTARSKVEREFKKDIARNATAPRPKDMPGYNATFDLWSTGGTSRNREVDGEQEDIRKWVKNW